MCLRGKGQIGLYFPPLLGGMDVCKLGSLGGFIGRIICGLKEKKYTKKGSVQVIVIAHAV